MVGSRLGPYEILHKLGEGGMGEVYRARDSKLNRDVAIKILPDLFAADTERLARFEREAQTLAALNHPNIAHIYGFIELPSEAGTRTARRPALVMECVDGEDLAQRIAHGPLPLDETISIARQIAEALEAAHERGIIHRDLKPANVKVTPDGVVKVLDFGLAKAIDALADVGQAFRRGSGVANSQTFTSPAMLTDMGVILGTAAYMSPEQARGKAMDKRVDVWAFGCVLYELLTRRPAFAGETVADILTAVMTRTPDVTVLPGGTPASVKRLLERCLERDPKRRLRDIGEARITLEQIEDAGPAGESQPSRSRTSSWRAAVPWAIAAVAVIAALVSVSLGALRRPVPARELPPLTYRLTIPDLSMMRSTLPALSRDGRRLAYVARGALWVRDLDQLEPRHVSGVQNPRFLFWSPDGREIAYVYSDALWRVPAEGGRPVMIAAARFVVGARTPAGVWRPDGSIIFAPSAAGSGLLSVSDQGGEVRTLRAQDSTTESDFHRPSLLPDGESLMFVVDRLDKGADTIGVLAHGQRKDVLTLPGETLDSPVYSPTGHIVYQRETTAPGIWAVPFSLDRLETTGEPFLIVAGGSWPSVTPNGMLIYVGAELTGLMQLAWVDHSGASTPAFPETFPAIESPRLSPDGHRLAAVVRVDRTEAVVTIFDLRRQTRAVIERLSAAQTAELSWWGRDRVVISRLAAGRYVLAARRTDGSGGDEILCEGVLPDGSRDGKALLFARIVPGTGYDLWHLADGTPRPLIGTAHRETQPALSPDAALLAYASNETGEMEVFMRPYPQDGPKVQVSSRGGQFPRWSPAGDRIYYRSGVVSADGITGVMEVTVDRRGGLSLGSPRPVTIPGGIETYPGGFDVAPDGSGLIIVRSVGGGTDPSLVVLQNWAARADR